MIMMLEADVAEIERLLGIIHNGDPHIHPTSYEVYERIGQILARIELAKKGYPTGE